MCIWHQNEKEVKGFPIEQGASFSGMLKIESPADSGWALWKITLTYDACFSKRCMEMFRCSTISRVTSNSLIFF